MIPGILSSRLRLPVVVAAAAGALALAGCSGSSGAKGPTGDQVTAVTEMSGEATTVSLDSGTLAAFSALEVKLKPLGAAKQTGTSIAFPITSGYAEIHSDHAAKGGWIQGQIEHDTSGFSITAGKTTLMLTNFVIDPGTSMLYGTVNGSTAKEPLLFLDSTKVTATVANGLLTLDGAEAELTQTAATALDGAFGTSQVKAGLKLGSVHLVAQATHVVTFAAAKVTNLDLTGLSTSLKLDPAARSSLGSLGVNLSTIGTAKNSDNTLSFPITGGFLGMHSDQAFQPGPILGSINHEASGLVFSGHGTSLTLRDFEVDPGNAVLSARVPDRSGSGGTILPLLTLDESKVKVSTDSSGNTVLDGAVASLTAEAAKQLNTTLGTSGIKAGMTLGTIHLVASTATS